MKKVISLILFSIILIGSAVVYAANTNDSYEVNLKYSLSSIKPGDIVTLQIVIENLNLEGENGEVAGVAAVKGTLSFDESIFELDKFEGTNWELTSNGKTFLANSKDGNTITEATEIGKVTLKVKEQARLGNAVVSILNIEGSVGSLNLTDMDGKNKPLTLVISNATEKPQNEEPQNEEPKSEEPQNEEPKNEEPQNEEQKNEELQNEEPKNEEPQNEEQKNEELQNENQGDNKKNTEIDNINSTEDKTTAVKKIPQTGTVGIIIPVIFIVILAGGAIALFKKYKKTI